MSLFDRFANLSARASPRSSGFCPALMATTNDLKHGCRVIFRIYGVDLDILQPILVFDPAGIRPLK